LKTEREAKGRNIEQKPKQQSIETEKSHDLLPTAGHFSEFMDKLQRHSGRLSMEEREYWRGHGYQ